ncbi:MAG: YitT family protein [Anaerolineales bacterium]|nr:YitT family protein [Anaerolineales bacterium]
MSYWPVVGGYTGETRTVIVCTVYRPQLADLKRIVAHLDPNAFVTIGVTQEALGRGFGELAKTK